MTKKRVDMKKKKPAQANQKKPLRKKKFAVAKKASQKKAVKKVVRKMKKTAAKKTAKKKVVTKSAPKKVGTKAEKKSQPEVSKTPSLSKKVVATKKTAAKTVIKEPERSSDLGLTPMRIYLNQIEHIPLLTAHEELDLSERIQKKKRGWQLARKKMIQSNLRLVINLAKRYANIGLPFSDIVEEGNIGLMRAVDKFNYAKGYRFSTYATWWIKQSIMRALSNQSKMIRIPVHMYESITKWRKTREAFIQRKGKIPTQKEIASMMKVPIDKIREIEGVLSNPGSLNIPLSLDSSNELIDLIEDKAADKPYQASHDDSRFERIKELFEVINDREKKVLIYRFGLGGVDRRTLEEIAQEFSITRERVRQIEEAALKKIREHTKDQNDSLLNYI